MKVNGVWKIHKDHVYTTFFAAYDPGWSYGSRPTPKASPKIPPDLPPSEKYEAFPEVYMPPFHYKNPVSGGETPAQPAIAHRTDACQRARHAHAARDERDAARRRERHRESATRVRVLCRQGHVAGRGRSVRGRRHARDRRPRRVRRQGAHSAIPDAPGAGRPHARQADEPPAAPAHRARGRATAPPLRGAGASSPSSARGRRRNSGARASTRTST